MYLWGSSRDIPGVYYIPRNGGGRLRYRNLPDRGDCTVSPRERSVDASEVHDSHHRLRFVMFTYNASYDPLAGAPSMLAFFLDSCLERINSATPGFILLELLSAFA